MNDDSTGVRSRGAGDSFTTFFLLSYVKVLSVSSDLLIYIHVYTLDGKSSTLLFYDPTLHYSYQTLVSTLGH